jgi:hypothetical protein
MLFEFNSEDIAYRRILARRAIEAPGKYKSILAVICTMISPRSEQRAICYIYCAWDTGPAVALYVFIVIRSCRTRVALTGKGKG